MSLEAGLELLKMFIVFISKLNERLVSDFDNRILQI